jgi:hypothetical protein
MWEGGGVARERGWLVAVEWMKLPPFINDKILRAEYISFLLCCLYNQMEKRWMKISLPFLNHIPYNVDIEANIINNLYQECIWLLFAAGISDCSV